MNIFYCGLILFLASSPVFSVSPNEVVMKTAQETQCETARLAGFLSVSEYVASFMSQYKMHRGCDLSNQVISMRLHPKDWQYFCALQHEIVRIIPTESKRPTIDLTLTTGCNSRLGKSIGILGTGPLADSKLIELMMTELEKRLDINWNHFAINLFSSPPPRTLKERFWGGLPYLKGLAEFATRGHDYYFLASNTAHLKFNPFRKLVGFSGYRLGRDSKNSIMVDLVDHVVSEVLKQDTIESNLILVLGTHWAYTDSLYPKYLARNELIPGRLNSSATDDRTIPGRYYVVSSDLRARELQSYIEMAKAGLLDQAGEKIKNFIIEEIESIESPSLNPKNNAVIKVILGCTEIALALSKPFLEELTSHFSDKSNIKLKLFNTNELFLGKIIDQIELLELSNISTHKELEALAGDG
jgi:aspartate/glutamate racemase